MESMMTYNQDCTEEQKQAIQRLRDAFMVAENAVLTLCPYPSRRGAESLTHLEAGLMFAVKAIAMGK